MYQFSLNHEQSEANGSFRGETRMFKKSKLESGFKTYQTVNKSSVICHAKCNAFITDLIRKFPFTICKVLMVHSQLF